MAQFDWNDPKLNWAWDNNRHTVTLTAGYNSLIGIYSQQILEEYLKNDLDNGTVITSNQAYGNYGIQYHYNFLKWLRLGMKLSFDVNKLTIDANVITTYYANLMPSLQFTYYNTDRWRVYSGIDLGVTFYVLKNYFTQTLPAFNITPIGFSYGRGIILFVETNVGFDAVIKGGIGIRL